MANPGVRERSLIGAGHQLTAPKLWPPNAMRHSFVDYHAAAFGYPARTAMETGHSVEVLHRHYRQL